MREVNRQFLMIILGEIRKNLEKAKLFRSKECIDTYIDFALSDVEKGFKVLESNKNNKQYSTNSEK